jgi:TetR/AcrR family transcriptional repressor of mexJK operon
MEAEILLPPILRAGRDEKRDAILRIACDAFLEDGYAATSMSAIAAKVGGSKATLYNYFASKEELFAAVISEKCQDIHYLVFEAEAPDPDIRVDLTRLGTRMLRLILSDEKIAIYRLVTAETARFPELGRAFYESGPGRGKKILSQYFDRAIEEGKLKPGNTLVMSGHFFDLLKGELHHRKLWNVTDRITDEEILESTQQSIDVFLAAYGA